MTKEVLGCLITCAAKSNTNTDSVVVKSKISLVSVRLCYNAARMDHCSLAQLSGFVTQ